MWYNRTMKIIKLIPVIFIFSLLVQPLSAFGKKDKSEENQKPAAEEKAEEKPQDDFISIDLLLETKNPQAKSHFNWQTSSSKYKDYYDAVSGASKLHTTKNFRTLMMDTTAKDFKIPHSLYGLCLFPVSSPELFKNDNFTVTQESKKLTITFTHRGTDYKIETKEDGSLEVPKGFSDIPPQSVKSVFTGTLKLNLAEDGKLTAKGKLRLAKNEVEKPEETKPDEAKPEEADSTPPSKEEKN